jgi:carbon monoxide dehydrogenase subunit G
MATLALTISMGALPGAALCAEGVEIVEAESEGIKGLVATFEVSQPRAVVFETLNDTKGFKDIFPKIHEVKVVREEGTTRDIFFRVDAVFADASYTLRRVYERGPSMDVIVWNRLSGDANVIRGSWTLTDAKKPGVTKVVYRSFVDVSAVVPMALVRSVAISNVHEMVDRVRAACDRRAAKR